MNKNTYIGLGVLVIIILILVVLFRGTSENPQTTDVGDTTSGGDVSSAMPVPDGDTTPVDDMVVAEDSTEETGAASEEAVKEYTVDSFNFGYSMTEIRVTEGDTVTINLTNSNGLHDWVVDEFNAATEKIQAGGETSVTFVADKTGTYEFYCSVGNHREQGMVGLLIVEPRT